VLGAAVGASRAVGNTAGARIRAGGADGKTVSPNLYRSHSRAIQILAGMRTSKVMWRSTRRGPPIFKAAPTGLGDARIVPRLRRIEEGIGSINGPDKRLEKLRGLLQGVAARKPAPGDLARIHDTTTTRCRTLAGAVSWTTSSSCSARCRSAKGGAQEAPRCRR